MENKSENHQQNFNFQIAKPISIKFEFILCVLFNTARKTQDF